MKVLLNLLLTLCFLCTSGCIKEIEPNLKEGKILSFNPSKSIDLSGYLEDYPDATGFYIGVEGVTGVQISAEEARLVGSVNVGARGSAPHYNVIISTPSGDVRTIAY